MRVALTTILLLFVSLAYSQSKKLEKAKSLVQVGMLAEDRGEYDEALAMYQKASKMAPEYLDAWYYLGQNLGKTGGESEVQISAYKKVSELDNSGVKSLRALSRLSQLYLERGIFDTSLIYYEQFVNHPRLPEKDKAKASEQLKQKKYAAGLYAHPLNMDPWPLSDWINQEGSMNYFPVLTGDESQMLFTRRSKGSQNEDLFLSIYLGDWQEAERLPGSINSIEAEGTATISSDGKTIVCSYCSNQRENMGNCDLYISKLEGRNWSQLKNLGEAINTEAYESQPSLSADGRTLFFTSDREGGLGGLDIWWSTLDESGNWTKPQNAGPVINTAKDDGSPFFHPNGTSLFFASKGHQGMGGYDLFLSEWEENSWTKARNLGYPINDQNNQVSLYVNAMGTKGYFSREEYGEGSAKASSSRIWTFDVPAALKLGHRSNYVKGKVMDNVSKMPINASLRLVDLETGEEKGVVESNLLTGEYLVMLSEGSEYAFYAETKGYLFKSIAFNYKEQRDLDPIQLDIFLDPIIKGVTVQLNNIYFETGKARLLSKSKIELDKLYQLMLKNPTLRIELGGHTDNTGSEETNEQLSQQRVDAVKAHLVKKGISADRMVGKGYGESKPVAGNDSAAGRAKNRRVEFTVL